MTTTIELKPSLPIINKTAYDQESVAELSRLHTRKNLVWFFISVILLVYLSVDAWRAQYDNYITFLIVFAVLGALLIGAAVFMLMMTGRRANVSYGIVRTKLTYRFEEQRFTLQINREGRTHEKQFSYRALRKVLDRGNNVFIFTSSTSTIILKKDGFKTAEDWDNVKALFQASRVKIRYA